MVIGNRDLTQYLQPLEISINTSSSLMHNSSHPRIKKSRSPTVLGKDPAVPSWNWTSIAFLSVRKAASWGLQRLRRFVVFLAAKNRASSFHQWTNHPYPLWQEGSTCTSANWWWKSSLTELNDLGRDAKRHYWLLLARRVSVECSSQLLPPIWAYHSKDKWFWC